jgi:hypothetical protein
MTGVCFSCKGVNIRRQVLEFVGTSGRDRRTSNFQGQLAFMVFYISVLRICYHLETGLLSSVLIQRFFLFSLVYFGTYNLPNQKNNSRL